MTARLSRGNVAFSPGKKDKKNLFSRDRADLHRLGVIGANAMGGNFKVGPAAQVNYEASGASDDWAKGGAGIKYSYTIELPDTGRSGHWD